MSRLDGKRDGREIQDAGKQPSFLLQTPFVLLRLLSLLRPQFFQKSARGCLLRQRPNYQSHLTKWIELQDYRIFCENIKWTPCSSITAVWYEDCKVTSVLEASPISAFCPFFITKENFFSFSLCENSPHKNTAICRNECIMTWALSWQSMNPE